MIKFIEINKFQFWKSEQTMEQIHFHYREHTHRLSHSVLSSKYSPTKRLAQFPRTPDEGILALSTQKHNFIKLSIIIIKKKIAIWILLRNALHTMGYLTFSLEDPTIWTFES